MADERPLLPPLPAPLAVELSRLDPWSFWTVPVEEGRFAIVGTTGAFLVQVHDGEGYLEAGRRRATVGRERVGGLWRLRRSATALQAQLGRWAVLTTVEPVVCLTRATSGSPRTVAGVRLVPVSHLSKEIAGRRKTLNADRARRGAERLTGGR